MKKALNKIENEKQENKVFALISSALPFPSISGVLTQVINARISGLEEERVNLLFQEVKKEIERIKLSISVDFIKTDKFSIIFETAYKTAINAKTKEKIKQIKNAFIHAIEAEDNYEDSIDFFNLINNLENIHIIILKRCWEQLSLARKLGSPTSPIVTLDGLSDFYKKVPKRTIERTCNHLIGLGLLEIPKGKIGPGVYTLTDYGVFFCEKIIKE